MAPCDPFADKVNAWVHPETGRAPVDMLAEEATHLHVLPVDAHTSALGDTRVVGHDQTIRWRLGALLDAGVPTHSALHELTSPSC